MKKVFSFLLILLGISAAVYAYDFRSGDVCYNITSNKAPYTVEVTYESGVIGNSYKGVVSVVIPSAVNYEGITYQVTAIGNSAFNGCTELASIHIPPTITRIGRSALYNTAWAKGHILDGPVVLGHVLVYYQGKMPENHTVVIPENVTVISDEAFWNYSNLIAVAFHDDITHIGDRAFSYCKNLLGISLPQNLVSIGANAFNYCQKIAGPLVIPDKVTTIGQGAFWGCTNLTSLTIGKSVRRIEESAFYGCNITSVAWNAIHYDDSSDMFAEDAPLASISAFITSFAFGEDVEYVPHSLCRGRYKLTSITFPASVTGIGSFAFYGSGLTEITSNNPTPPTVWESTFRGIDRNIPVYVPTEEAVTAYSNADHWKEFFNIRTFSTGLRHNDAQQVTPAKVLRNGQVLIQRNGKTYNILGNTVETSDAK